MTSRPAAAQHLRDLSRLRRAPDRIDREYAQPLDVEALARGVYMIDGEVEVLEIDALPQERGDRFAAHTGFDPRRRPRLTDGDTMSMATEVLRNG